MAEKRRKRNPTSKKSPTVRPLFADDQVIISNKQDNLQKAE